MSDVYPASSRRKARVNGHQTGAKNSKTCELPQTNEWIGNTDHHERNVAIPLVFTLNVHCETGSGMAVVTVSNSLSSLAWPFVTLANASLTYVNEPINQTDQISVTLALNQPNSHEHLPNFIPSLLNFFFSKHINATKGDGFVRVLLLFLYFLCLDLVA